MNRASYRVSLISREVLEHISNTEFSNSCARCAFSGSGVAHRAQLITATNYYGTDQLGRIGGFSLHAGVAVNTRERKKLFDPVTPPASALKAAEHYSYHWDIVKEYASHDMISHSSCARS